MYELLISFTVFVPQSCIVFLNSSYNILIIFSTPYYPPQAKLNTLGLPTNTQSAPRATALKISFPLLTPPSTYTSHFPLHTLAISSNTSIGANAPSNYLPP